MQFFKISMKIAVARQFAQGAYLKSRSFVTQISCFPVFIVILLKLVDTKEAKKWKKYLEIKRDAYLAYVSHKHRNERYLSFIYPERG